MMKIKRGWILTGILGILSGGWLALPLMSTAAAAPAGKSTVIRAIPGQIDHWRALRFGMFIHWGPVSLTGKEIGWSRATELTDTTTPWPEYDQLYKQFNPTAFNAAEWVSIAKDTGMKYIVLTSKHHDGFCLWDSAYTDHDIMASPFKRDVMKELTDECKRQGMLFGPYHSICDWYQPDYGYSHQAQPGYKLDRAPDINRHVEYLKNQLREMNQKYGPFLVFWFDGEWEEPWTHTLGVDLNNFCKRLQPDALVNNRVDKGRRGMQGMSESGDFAGDYGTPEQEIGGFNRESPWETCMTICTQWSWKPNDQLKSLQQCLQTLIYTAGGDGNLLLNVGPMPDGRIEPRQVERLKEIGAWMKTYGGTIYGTRGGPFKPGAWGASTCQDNRIHLFIMKTNEGKLNLPPIGRKVLMHEVLTGEAIDLKPSDQGIQITMDGDPRDGVAAIVTLEVDGDAVELPPIEVK